jgi:[ribosomal protein S5]-alanine N-acetyltransferase
MGLEIQTLVDRPVINVSKEVAPTLYSDTVCLRQLSEDDAEPLLDSECHEEINKSVAWESHRTLEDCRRLCHCGNDLAWVSRDILSGQALGSVGLTELSPICAEVTFTFHSERWKRRNSMESLWLVLDWAFTRYPQYKRIQARCFPTRPSSGVLLDNLGMRFEGVSRAAVQFGDDVYDLSCYAMTRADWMRKRLQDSDWSFAGDAFVHM